MATQAHCAFGFETLSAYFEHRKALSLEQVEELWEQYHTTSINREDARGSSARPAAISRLLRSNDRSATSSTSSLPSTRSDVSSTASPAGTVDTTPASSEISLVSPSRRKLAGKYPLFVTWNRHTTSGQKSLRGCIGTFEAQELEYGLSTYALTSALEDHRFSPITAKIFPQLSNHVTLLTDFSNPVSDPLAWTIGVHGIRISFSYHGRRYGSTYLPDVAKEQGWTKDEALISLMKKAGWNGNSSNWQKTWNEGRGELITYEGKQVGLEYDQWREWRDWVDDQDITPRGLKS